MGDSAGSFESELRISPKLIIPELIVVGLACLWFADAQPAPPQWVPGALLAMLLFAVSVVAWWLDSWQTQASRWLVVAALVAMVYLGHRWLAVPGLLTLMAIPAALAAALISIPAAGATALGETLLLLILARAASGSPTWTNTGVAIAGIWTMLGVMLAVYRPVYEVGRRAVEYLEKAHRLIEETRTRKVELQQALDDLARANLQLRRLNDLAQGLRKAAEDARVAKEQFVANVSHELRTPLNMITGFSEMMLQTPGMYGGKVPSALLADLTVIHRNAEHLAELIDDVLDLSQVEAKQMALTREWVRFAEIVEEAATAVRPLFVSRGLYLETTVAEELPPVFCDRTRIREVLLNLLSNAGRFTESGGVRLCVLRESEEVVVSIADTGCGIAAEDIGKLFEPFRQVDGSIRRRYGGTGLGLAISRRFIELHGGSIRVESQEGIGTTFVLRIPLGAPLELGSDTWRRSNPDWEYLQPTRPSKAPRIAARPRIVVVEEGDALRRLLNRYWDGVEVAPASSLQEAAEGPGRTPAQALVLNAASVGEGIEELRASGALPEGMPAIVCSVTGVEGDAAAMGVSERLVKPVSREGLLAALDRLHIQDGTILVVDDEPDALHLFTRMLESTGRPYRVLLARDGREAFTAMREYRPDAILLDLVMPNMDGFQLLEAKMHDPAVRDIPVVVVSARDRSGRPIVSSALAATRQDGLAAHELLACIEFLSKTLSATGQAGGPVPRETPSGQPACG